MSLFYIYFYFNSVFTYIFSILGDEEPLKYVFCPQETGRTRRRPSNFWIGLYRENWLIAFDSSHEWVESMLSFVRHKKSFYHRKIRAIKLIGQLP